MPHKLKRIQGRQPTSRRFVIFLVFLVVATIGSYFLIASHALSNYVTAEADKGNVVSPAVKVADRSTSDGNYVQFGSGSTTTGWPNASNTGVKLSECGVSSTTSLPSVTSDMTITTAGTLVKCKYFNGHCINVQANNVTIDDTLIKDGPGCANQHQIDAGSSTGLLIEDTEIDGQDQSALGAAIGDAGYTVLRANIHNVGQGVHLDQGTIKDSYIHDITTCNSCAGGSYSHNEAVITNGGLGPAVIQHNNLVSNSSASNPDNQTVGSVDLFGDFGPVENFTVDDNLLSGGGYCTYAGVTNKPHPGTNISFTNNHFSTQLYPNCGAYGPVINFAIPAGSNNVWSGNVWDNKNGNGPPDGSPVGY